MRIPSSYNGSPGKPMKKIPSARDNTDGGRYDLRTPVAVRNSKRGNFEISYSSTLLFLWAFFLSVLAWRAQFRMQAGTILTLCTVALTSDHGESRLLMPLIFLSERCLDHAMGLGHAPVEFYASTVLSYLSLVACKAVRRGKSTRDRNVVAETVLYAIVGLCVVVFIVQDRVFSFGAVVYVTVGHVVFLRLLPHLGDNEAVLVSSLIGFYMCDACTNNNLSYDGGRDGILSLHAPVYQTMYTHIAARGMVLVSIYVTCVVSVLSRFCLVPVNENSKSAGRQVLTGRITAVYWAAVVIISVIVFSVISFHFQENVMGWLYFYIVSSRFRLYTGLSWILLLPIAVVFVELFTRALRKTVRRKMFHLIAVVAFTPAAMIDPPFLALAISVATSLAIMVEVARYHKVHGANTITAFIRRHIDDRDRVDGIVRTHIYLLVGLGISMMMRYRHQHFPSRPVPAVMELSINIIPGIVSLGVVDAAAAVTGSSFFLSYRRTLGRYLKNNVFTERANVSITHKTLTGTLGGLVCGLIFWALTLALAEVPLSGPVWLTFTMILVCTVTECFMEGIDNLQMPLVVLGAVYSLFALIMPMDALWQDERVRQPNPTTASSLASALRTTWSNWPSAIAPLAEKVGMPLP